MKAYGSRPNGKVPPRDAFGGYVYKIIKARERRRKPYHFHVGWDGVGSRILDVWGNSYLYD